MKTNLSLHGLHRKGPKARLCLLGTGLLAVLVCWPLIREPFYGGHWLSEWVELYGAEYSGHGCTTNRWASQEETEEAIRHSGSRAVPFLVHWIRQAPKPRMRSGSNRMMDTLWNWGPSMLRPTLRRWWANERPFHRVLGAVTAFGLFGTNANCAIPELAAIANLPGDISGETHEPAWGIEYDSLPNRRAVFALANIGPATTPVLLNLAATTRSENLRRDLVYSLSRMGTNALPAVPLLLQLIKVPTNRTAAIAARTLGVLKLEPAVVVPVLTNALESRKQLLEWVRDGTEPRLAFQYEAIQALAAYGPDARSALPAIIRCLGEENPYTSWMAADALGRLGLEPELVVPSLTRSLQSPDPYLVRSAAKSLGAYGSASAMAVPLLMNVAHCTNGMRPTKIAAERALGRITNAVPTE
jgi:HEAT repeat protein